MNPPSEDIKDILESSGHDVGLTFGTDLFISSMPDDPDHCACVYDTGGLEPMAQYIYQYPTVQITVRGKRESGYRNAWVLAESIRDELNSIHNEVWNSTTYIGIWVQSDILQAGHDDNKRPLLTINFRIHRTE